MYSVVTQSTEFVQDGFCCNRRLMLPGLPQAGNHTEDFAVQGKDCFMTKKILCVFMVFALIFSLGACKKDKDNLPTGSDSTTTVGQTDDTSVSTTISATEVVTDENGEPVTDKNGDAVVTDTTVAPLISDETMPTGKKVEVTTTANGKPVDALVDSAMGNILKGEKYSIKFTAQIDMDGSKQNMPAAVYVSGKKSLVELTMSGAGLGLGLGKMSVLNNDAGSYMLISILGFLKGYVQIPAEEAGEYSMFDFSGISGTEDMQYVQTTKVTYKGVEYIAEEYRSSDATIKFFFNNGKLKRIEQVSDDGTTIFMENIEVSASFNESVFDIPAGYKEIDEKDLEGLTGLLG